MTRWTRIATVVPLTVLLFAGAAPARADDCPLLDLCTVEEVVDDTVDTVEEVVDDTVDTVTDTTSGATDTVENIVDGVLGEDSAGEAPSPGDDNGGGSGDDGGSAGDGGKGDGEDRRARNTGGRASRAGLLTTLASPSSGSVFQGSEAASVGIALNPSLDRSLPDRLTTAAAEAAKGIATVLLLLGVVVAFVLIQDRLDKKDPKLALAPTRSDVVRFG